jgi:hypothetical protein
VLMRPTNVGSSTPDLTRLRFAKTDTWATILA